MGMVMTKSFKRGMPPGQTKANRNSEVTGSKAGQGLGGGQRRGPLTPSEPDRQGPTQANVNDNGGSSKIV